MDITDSNIIETTSEYVARSITDTAKTTTNTYSYPTMQNYFLLTNNGDTDLHFNVGCFTSITIHRGQTWSNNVDFKEFQIYSKKDCSFTALSKEYAKVTPEASFVPYIPTLTWSTATPIGITTVAKAKRVGNIAYVTISINATDGNGATSLYVSLPDNCIPKNQNLKPSLACSTMIGTTSSPKSCYVRDDGTNNNLRVTTGTATAGSAFMVSITGFYEI